MSETTGSDGKATFETEYGDYKVRITADGYVTKTETVAFRSNHKNFTIKVEEQVLGDYDFKRYNDDTGEVDIGTLNIGEITQYDKYPITFMTCTDPTIFDDADPMINDIRDCDGFTAVQVSNDDGGLYYISLIEKQTVGVRVIDENDDPVSCDVILASDEIDWSNPPSSVDFTKVVGMASFGDNDGELLYTIDPQTYAPVDVAIVQTGTYYLYCLDSRDIIYSDTVTINERNNAILITVEQQDG